MGAAFFVIVILDFVNNNKIAIPNKLKNLTYITASIGSRVLEASCEKIRPKANIPLAINDTIKDSFICFFDKPRLSLKLSALIDTNTAPEITIKVAIH